MCLKDNLWATLQYLTCIFLAAFCIFVHAQDDMEIHIYRGYLLFLGEYQIYFKSRDEKYLVFTDKK